jgi:hypothetical protein
MSAQKSAFEQGREHAQLGKSIHYNPYRNRTGEGALYVEWQAGWQSYQDEQKCRKGH